MSVIKNNIRIIIILLLSILFICCVVVLNNLNNNLNYIKERIEFMREQSCNQHDQIEHKAEKVLNQILQDLEAIE